MAAPHSIDIDSDEMPLLTTLAASDILVIDTENGTLTVTIQVMIDALLELYFT